MNDLTQNQCQTHSQMIKDMHLAVCGDAKLGIPGIVEAMKGHNDRITTLEVKEASLRTKLFAGAGLIIGGTLGLKEALLALLNK